MSADHRVVRVPPSLAGARADKIVAAALELSRSDARRIFDDGGVVTDGERVAPSERLSEGTALEVRWAVPDDSLQPMEVAFEVAYVDDDVIVVDKPPGVVVHPGAGRTAGTLVNGLVHRFPELLALGEGDRWGLVHRLDRDTSGLLMVGRSADAARSLRDSLRERRVTRRYLAMVLGDVPSATGTIDAPIGRDPRNPTRMAVVHLGKPARTHYERLATWDDVALLGVRLDTGRTHQIRVHLASIDHPVVGDPVYGRPGGTAADAGRVWLHATRLVFPHPATATAVTVESALPSDLAASLDRLGPPVGGEWPPAG